MAHDDLHLRQIIQLVAFLPHSSTTSRSIKPICDHLPSPLPKLPLCYPTASPTGLSNEPSTQLTPLLRPLAQSGSGASKPSMPKLRARSTSATSVSSLRLPTLAHLRNISELDAIL